MNISLFNNVTITTNASYQTPLVTSQVWKGESPVRKSYFPLNGKSNLSLNIGYTQKTNGTGLFIKTELSDDGVIFSRETYNSVSGATITLVPVNRLVTASGTYNLSLNGISAEFFKISFRSLSSPSTINVSMSIRE